MGVGFAAYGFSASSRGQTPYEGIWFMFIAFILVSTARGTETRLRLRSELAKGRAREAMRPPPSWVPADMSLADVLRDYLRGREHESFPVVQDGRVIGTISMASARRVGGRDPLRPARDGLVPLSAARSVPAESGLDDALDLLGGQEGMVLEDGRLVGIHRAGGHRALVPGASAGRSPGRGVGPAPSRPVGTRLSASTATIRT